MNFKRKLKNTYYNYKNRKKNIYVENNVYISKKTTLEGNNKIYNNTKLIDSFVGFGTYISQNTKMINTSIGRYCSIGENVEIVLGKHPVDTFVSTHPAFFSLKKQSGFTYVESQKFEEHSFVDEKSEIGNKRSVSIGNDVWIGRNVLIMEGVNIGDGAIIGTGSIVTRNVESYSINVGIPAKKIKYRFAQKQIDFLLKYKWWEKDEKWLKENIKKFEDVEMLYESFHNNENF